MNTNQSHENSRPIILLSANSSWNIVNFRTGLIRGLIGKGYRIIVAAPRDEHTSRITDIGAGFIDLPVNSSGVSVAQDARLFLRYCQIAFKLRPFAYLGFTAKPNIYGSLAAGMAGAKVINNITGLGTVFIKPSFLTVLVKQFYRLALRRSSTVLFQNRRDLEFFVGKNIVSQEKTDLVPGDGVDLNQFRFSSGARKPGPFRFLLVGRLLWDKGIGEYVEAARSISRQHPGVIFQVLGPAGVNNRTAIPAEMLKRWHSEGVIDYLGETDDVRPALRQSDCVVLPSYREGLPRTLLEGSAMGKPLIATDVPGCRDVVLDGETGYLCKARSSKALADAMLKMLRLPLAERRRMGECGRLHIERSYSEAFVVAKYLEVLGRP